MSISCTRGPLYTITSAGRHTPDASDVALIRSIAAGDKHAMQILFTGVFLGTPMPCHELASYPGTKSPTGGRSGSAGERAAVVTANPRNLPALTYSMTVGITSKLT